MRYEWDEAKREANLVKHDVDFKAASNFLWPRSVTIPDRRKDYMRKANRREEMYYEEET
ncbi:MAG: BrnT family toxin [Mariprofundaceae bacterium]|nr:BrnT family toxin [Mariprofundaceae bacterium]